MYEFLTQELATLKWPGFHVVDGARSVPDLDPALPPSYLEFARRFGNARLYRKGDAYDVGVRVPPEPETRAGRQLLCVGHYYWDRAYLVVDELAPGHEATVYEWSDGALEPAAASFGEWLVERSTQAREAYEPEEWEQFVRGPAPFTVEEEARVRARRQIEWTRVAASEPDLLRVRIRNRSELTLGAFSLGMRWPSGAESRLALNVATVPPGGESIIEHHGSGRSYEGVELFDLPDPAPETRELYPELRPV
jgi:hypothetical protein